MSRSPSQYGPISPRPSEPYTSLLLPYQNAPRYAPLSPHGLPRSPSSSSASSTPHRFLSPPVSPTTVATPPISLVSTATSNSHGCQMCQACMRCSAPVTHETMVNHNKESPITLLGQKIKQCPKTLRMAFVERRDSWRKRSHELKRQRETEEVIEIKPVHWTEQD
ncbi:uncharacterized protein K452DRAFT_293075 [Aplosporella prunicola CBS 121167]|uniref:Uncharacterized protein n=1 Tax=Aplosporella prunicola CBS 121167 TaxID=1176127 RepID=A0A6A6AXZ7_9PEZI|nr:uncharacterized protein K452DRAFT_293075 [Aplosporella prunicola CBS 121167]KAF2135637.1 hypothetical protein K452DRAFT_293075 [Aplosporella prunicola CBS 121167]